MTRCIDVVERLINEKPDMTDKEITAEMKKIKDEKGKRLYKSSTIRTRRELVRSKLKEQPATSEQQQSVEKVNKLEQKVSRFHC